MPVFLLAQLDRLLKRGNSRGGVTMRIESRTEIVVELNRRWKQFHRCLKLWDGAVELAGLLEREAQMIMRIGEIWIESHGSPEVLKALVHVAILKQLSPQVGFRA